jgi:hypothetical protein
LDVILSLLSYRIDILGVLVVLSSKIEGLVLGRVDENDRLSLSGGKDKGFVLSRTITTAIQSAKGALRVIDFLVKVRRSVV